MTTIGDLMGVDDPPVDPAPAPEPRAPKRRRGWIFWTGLVLVLSGLAMLAWVGWEVYGTNVVSRHRQHAIVNQLEEEWSKPGGGQATVDTGHGPSRAIIRIPAFGKDYAVPVIEGTDEDALASGIGHYTGTAGPGQEGNFALAGHRITHGEPLANMPDLVKGDTVVVETRDHTYTYVLDTTGDELRVPMQDTWVIDDVPVNPDGGVGPDPQATRLITLTTCAELFHTDDRFVAFGHLVKTAGPTVADGSGSSGR